MGSPRIPNDSRDLQEVLTGAMDVAKYHKSLMSGDIHGPTPGPDRASDNIKFQYGNSQRKHSNSEYDNPPKAGAIKHKMIARNRDVISVLPTGPGDDYFRLRNLAVVFQEGLSRSCRGPLGRFHKFRHGLPRGLLGSLALVGHCADPRVPSIPLAQPGRRFP